MGMSIQEKLKLPNEATVSLQAQDALMALKYTKSVVMVKIYGIRRMLPVPVHV